jgi:hypothetical protein
MIGKIYSHFFWCFLQDLLKALSTSVLVKKIHLSTALNFFILRLIILVTKFINCLFRFRALTSFNLVYFSWSYTQEMQPCNIHSIPWIQELKSKRKCHNPTRGKLKRKYQRLHLSKTDDFARFAALTCLKQLLFHRSPQIEIICAWQSCTKCTYIQGDSALYVLSPWHKAAA